MAGKLQTTLLGRKARITMGIADPEIEAYNKHCRDAGLRPGPAWLKLGQAGKVVAVGSTKEGINLAVEFADGTVVEVLLKEVVLQKEKKA